MRSFLLSFLIAGCGSDLPLLNSPDMLQGVWSGAIDETQVNDQVTVGDGARFRVEIYPKEDDLSAKFTLFGPLTYSFYTLKDGERTYDTTDSVLLEDGELLALYEISAGPLSFEFEASGWLEDTDMIDDRVMVLTVDRVFLDGDGEDKKEPTNVFMDVELHRLASSDEFAHLHDEPTPHSPLVLD